MIFAPESRPLYLVDWDGTRRLVLGWKSSREQIFPVVTDDGFAVPHLEDDLDVLARSRFIHEPATKGNR